MVKLLRVGNDNGNFIFKNPGEFKTDNPIIGKILKVYVDLGDVPVATVRISTTEGERIMDREFRESDVYKPLDVIVEGAVYDKFYSVGPLTIEILGSVSPERPLNEIRIFYE